MVEGDTPAQDKIDIVQFEKLCELQCTETEISGYFGVSHDTLLRWCQKTYNQTFAYVYEQKKGKGKIAIRRYQMQQAEKNPTMAIWLGKQYLGQRDNFEDEKKEESKVTIIDDISGEDDENN